jgi:tetratricopeptide (TPR) repeat protein
MISLTHSFCKSNLFPSKAVAIVFFSSIYSFAAFSQDKTLKETLLREVAGTACKCVDSISVYNKSRADVAKDINRCIANQTTAYQLTAQLVNLKDVTKSKDEKDTTKNVSITVNVNEQSAEYKHYYYELERYMMSNCRSIKEKIASNDKQNEHSLSDNPEALDLYEKGVEEIKVENVKKALRYFEKAVDLDPQFAFAWDNIGICYRKLEKFDEALVAYNKSLEVDPYGIVPLQNIAVVYQYKKQFESAIDAYKKLSVVESANPEVYYGVGRIYAINLNDMENGLQNMCKAYNLYIEQKSPYRTDAEKIINTIYTEMKKSGKEEEFRKILKENNISSN